MVLATSPIPQINDLWLHDEAAALLMLADNGNLTPPVAVNSSKILDISPEIVAPLNLSAPTPVGCFRTQQRQPVVYADYLSVLEQIVVMRDAMQSRQWEMGPSRQRGWFSGSASIELLGPYPRTPFAFQIIYVAHLAVTIAKECLVPEMGFLGGGVRFGVNKEFGVLVVGQRPAPGVVAVASS